MDLQSLLAILATALIGWVVYQKFLLFKKMAPGPYGLPIVGSLFHLTRTDPTGEFQKYRKKYGKVFSLGVGNFYVTVVTDSRLVVDNLKKDEFQGRPEFDLFKIRNQGDKNRGVLLSDGHVWNEQRRYVLRNLRDFGFGKESMEGMLLQELQELQNTLRKDLGHPVSLSGMFNASVLNSLWYIVTGKRFELDDPKLKRLITLLIDNVKGLLITTPAQFFFTPAKYGLAGQATLKGSLEFLAEVKMLVMEVIDEHWDTYEEGEVRDFVDAYIQQIKASSAADSSFHGEEGKKNLFAVLVDMFVAGAETTSTTLLWAMLLLSNHPEIQKKVQEEIDSVVGRSRPPNRSDKPKMAYLEAVLNEVHRTASLVPYSVYHRATMDAEIGGHFIPKDSVIFFSIYDSHNDRGTWGDPEKFRPERFLDKNGKLVKHEALIPFSSGKRQCLGETLARDTLFMFFTGLFQSFTFEIDPDCSNKNLEASRSFIRAPNPFKVIIKERK